jgi:hypothetical protein
MAMDVHTRRHRFGSVHVAVMRVVGGFAGTAHARGSGSARQRYCQRSQQANQCRSKHRVCPSPLGLDLSGCRRVTCPSSPHTRTKT